MQANVVSDTFFAGADLRTHQFKFVKISAAADATLGRIVLCGDGEPGIGVLVSKPNTGEAATVQIGGRAKVKAGGAIAVGAFVASGASGVAKAAVAGRTKTDDTAAAADPLVGSFVMGIMAQPTAAVENELTDVILTYSGAVATTAA
jgi:hypothetical protein